MLGWTMEIIGGITKEIINMGDELIEDIKHIPDHLEKGYQDGLFPSKEDGESGENPEESEAEKADTNSKDDQW